MSSAAWVAPGPLERWTISADIPITPAGVLLLDHVPGEDRGSGPLPRPIAGLPDGVDLVAIDATDPALILLCLDLPVSLSASAGVSRPGDVLGWDGASLTRVFDSAAAGIAYRVGCDAVARNGSNLLISFDVPVALPNRILPADLVAWNGAVLSIEFEGLAAGLAPPMNLDAVTVGPAGALWMSFDTAGAVAGITFADEDVLAYQPGAGTWTMVRRLADDSERWRVADLDALSVEFLSNALFSNGFE